MGSSQVTFNDGLLPMNYGLLKGTVASYFRQLGFPRVVSKMQLVVITIGKRDT